MTFEIEHLKNKVYYAQNREDLLLEAFFPDVKDGFFVDIGAYDPDYDSVTKLFYKKGWKGINVEPQPARYEKFVKARSRDINLNCGISDTKGTFTLRAYKNGGLATFSSEIKEAYSHVTDSEVANYEDIEVPVTTLKDMFKQHAPKTIHFMKVDIEGLEYEALIGNDWELYRPEVLCIESNHMIKDWKKLILKNDYSFVFFDGLNDYYADNRTKRTESFDYVTHMLTVRGGGIAYSDYYNVKQLNDQFKKLNIELQDTINTMSGKIHKKQLEIDAKTATLNSTKAVSRRLVRLLLNKLKG